MLPNRSPSNPFEQLRCVAQGRRRILDDDDVRVPRGAQLLVSPDFFQVFLEGIILRFFGLPLPLQVRNRAFGVSQAGSLPPDELQLVGKHPEPGLQGRHPRHFRNEANLRARWRGVAADSGKRTFRLKTVQSQRSGVLVLDFFFSFSAATICSRTPLTRNSPR